MPDRLTRREILERVSRGELTAEEGASLLGNPPVISSPPPEVILVSSPEAATGSPMGWDSSDDVPSAWKYGKWWMVPFGIATGITILFALFACLALINAGPGFWFYFWVVLFLLGTGSMILAWQTRSSRWIHMRIRQAPGNNPETINLSLPFPIGITTWFFRHFGRYIHQVRDIPMDQLLEEINRGLTPEAPLSVHVDDDHGEKVDIYIG